VLRRLNCEMDEVRDELTHLKNDLQELKERLAVLENDLKWVRTLQWPILIAVAVGVITELLAKLGIL